MVCLSYSGPLSEKSISGAPVRYLKSCIGLTLTLAVPGPGLAVAANERSEHPNTMTLAASQVYVDGEGAEVIAGLKVKYYRYAGGMRIGLFPTLTSGYSSADTKGHLGRRSDADIIYVTSGLSMAKADLSAPDRERERLSIAHSGDARIAQENRLDIDTGYERNWLPAGVGVVDHDALNVGMVYRL